MITLLKQTDKLTQLKGYQTFAEHGDLRAMIFLGNILRDKNQFEEAFKWYVLAFQTEWLQHGTYNPNAIRALEHIQKLTSPNDQAPTHIKRFLETYLDIYRFPAGHNEKMKSESIERNSFNFLGDYIIKPCGIDLTTDESALKKIKFTMLLIEDREKDKRNSPL